MKKTHGFGFIFVLVVFIFAAAYYIRSNDDVTNSALSNQEVSLQTEIAVFNPSSIQVDENRISQSGECNPSENIPGSYACALESGPPIEPCFAMASGELLCGSNPVFGTYQATVSPSNEISELADESSIFFISFGESYAPCSINTNPERKVGDEIITYRCEAPGAQVLGEINTSGSSWTADIVYTNPTTGEVTSTLENVPIETAWVTK